MANTARAWVDERSEPRNEVHYRARATGPDGRALHPVIVNISARGLMARCDVAYEIGEVVAFQLPVVGRIDGEVRWSLGGRMGCQLDRTIPLADYYALLAVMAR